MVSGKEITSQFYYEVVRPFLGIYGLSVEETSQNTKSFEDSLNLEAAFYHFNSEKLIYDFDSYLNDFLNLCKDAKRVLVFDSKLGRDAMAVLNVCRELDLQVDSTSKEKYVRSFLKKGANTGLRVHLSSITTFSPPPDTFYNAILVESALQHLNHDEVVAFLLRAIGWLKEEKTHSRSKKLIRNLSHRLRGLPLPTNTLLFRVKKSQTGCVYESDSILGKRYFTTWTEDQMLELIQTLEAAGAKLVQRKTNPHKDNEVPAFEQFVYTV